MTASRGSQGENSLSGATQEFKSTHADKTHPGSSALIQNTHCLRVIYSNDEHNSQEYALWDFCYLAQQMKYPLVAHCAAVPRTKRHKATSLRQLFEPVIQHHLATLLYLRIYDTSKAVQSQSF